MKNDHSRAEVEALAIYQQLVKDLDDKKSPQISIVIVSVWEGEGEGVGLLLG